MTHEEKQALLSMVEQYGAAKYAEGMARSPEFTVEQHKQACEEGTAAYFAILHFLYPTH